MAKYCNRNTFRIIEHAALALKILDYSPIFTLCAMEVQNEENLFGHRNNRPK